MSTNGILTGDSKQKKRIKLKMYFPVMSYIIVDLNIVQY